MSLILHQPQRVWPHARPPRISKRALARGLVWLSLGNGTFWSRKTGWVGYTTRNGSPRHTSVGNGPGLGYGATSGGGSTDYLVGPPLSLSTGFRSIVAHYQANTTGASGIGRIFQGSTGTGGDSFEAMFCFSGYKMTYSRYSNTQCQYGITGTTVTGEPQVFGITHDQRTVTTPLCYENGILGTTNTLSTGGTNYSTGDYSPATGNRPSDGARGWDGGLGRLAIFDDPNEGLRADEHLALAMNPDAWLFDAVPIPMYVGSALNNFLLAANQGTYALTGQVLNFTTSGRLQANQGSYVLAGQAAALRLGRKIALAQGSYGLTGQNVGLGYTPAAGTITTKPFKNNTGDLLTGLSGLGVVIIDLDDLSTVHIFTGQTTHGTTAVLSCTHGDLDAGTFYGVVTVSADGAVIGSDIIEAL